VTVLYERFMQAADSGQQEDEVMKMSSAAAAAAEQEKSTTSASTDGQKTDDENTVITVDFYPACELDSQHTIPIGVGRQIKKG